MKKRSKIYNASIAELDQEQRYQPGEVLLALRNCRKNKFDEMVDLAFKLGIDPKQAEQQIRGSFNLPHGSGKSRKVIVFAMGDKAIEARENGADEVGSDELVKKIQDGWMDFDIAISTPDMMGLVGKLGRLLGPQGKMPTPKGGTVTDHVANTVKEFKAGKIEFRNDSVGNLHASVGRLSFSDDQLNENINAFLDHLVGLKPSSSKGQFIRSASLSSTMSPSFKLVVSE
jgi:large subunit ribosomal protein L1